MQQGVNISKKATLSYSDKKTSKIYWEIHKKKAKGFPEPLKFKSMFEDIKFDLNQLEIIQNENNELIINPKTPGRVLKLK